MEGLGLMPQQAHLHGVEVLAVYPHAAVLHCLMREAHMIVETDGMRVVRPNLQLNSGDTPRPRFGDASLKKTAADPSAAVARQKAHSEVAAMSDCMGPSRNDVSPANDALVVECDELSDVALDIGADEGFDLLERRSLHHGQVASFACHKVQGLSEARSMRLADGMHGDFHGA